MRGLARRLAIVLCVLLTGIPAAMAADDDWTVLTMAQDGSWGVACHGSQWRAMAEAMRFCRSMAGASGASDCGANFATTRGGWIVANLCGDYKVLATGATLSEAEAEALNREISLQLQFVPDLPAVPARGDHRCRPVDHRVEPAHSAGQNEFLGRHARRAIGHQP